MFEQISIGDTSGLDEIKRVSIFYLFIKWRINLAILNVQNKYFESNPLETLEIIKHENSEVLLND